MTAPRDKGWGGLAFAAALMLPLSAHASDAQVGFQCTVTLDGKQHELHFSADLDQGRYTARNGNVPLFTQKEVSIDYSFGPTLKPTASQLKFTINTSPREYFLAIRADSQVWVTSVTGSFPRQIGTCKLDVFKGL